MLTIKYTNKDGWGAPVIHPFENLKVHPFSSGLNYAIQCYEGLKAYKDEKD
jgi:branched-chain amino acid aminotransferase